MVRNATIRHGRSFPLGATLYPEGVNFSMFSKSATLVEWLLFNDVHEAQPAHVIRLDPRRHRTYHYWHIFVPSLKAGQLYGYRVSGPYAPARGHRFDPDKVLLDPYGQAVAVPPHYSRRAAQQPGENTAVAMKSAVAAPQAYDWQGDAPLQRPFAHTVMYEMHVAGFTRHPRSGVAPAQRGTYAGLIEKIPYLADLGVTAVELLPVFQFDAQDAPPGRVN
jgi:isoamylase